MGVVQHRISAMVGRGRIDSGLGRVLPMVGVAAAGSPVDYASQVKPILTRHCVSCHGATKPKGGLRLDTAAAALLGGRAGRSCSRARARRARLVAAVRGEGETERMPLKRPPLAEAEIKLLQDWIDQGAKAIAGERPGIAPPSHWAFVPPKRPVVPEVSKPGWARNPIDRFILARLERAGLAPSPEADRATLLRRLSLDLIGLPPSPGEVDAFLADRPADADTNAQSIGCWPRPTSASGGPAPGSTWLATPIPTATASTPRARSGSTATGSSPLSTPTCRSTSSRSTSSPATSGPAIRVRPQIATGFHRNTPINQEGGIDVEQFRVESVVDRVNTTGTVFLGLTIGCCQCHDHKYDPISQREYYQLFAFFNNVDEPDLEIATPAGTGQAAADPRPDRRVSPLRWPASIPTWRSASANGSGRSTLEFTQAQEPDVRLAFDLPREKRSPTSAAPWSS